jgi:dsDNA-binding SOS-regulon protein
MAVESRFVVIRQGVEVETFMDKKAADEYDKMLDMADNLAEMFETASLALDEKMREELSIYLAKNRENVLVALQAKKVPVAKKKVAPKAIEAEASEPKVGEIEKTEPLAKLDVENSDKPVTKAKAPRKTKASTAKKTAA